MATVKEHTARDTYICSLCGKEIPRGERYLRFYNPNPSVARHLKCDNRGWDWDKTSSPFRRSAIKLVENYETDYEMTILGLESFITELKRILDIAEDNLANTEHIPREVYQFRVDTLENAVFVAEEFRDNIIKEYSNIPDFDKTALSNDIEHCIDDIVAEIYSQLEGE